MALSESDSKGDWEIFMVGQGDAPVDQIEEEMARAAEVEIARSERMAMNVVDKAAEKKHTSLRGRHGELVDSDDDVGDGAASGGHHPKFDWHRPAVWEVAERQWAHDWIEWQGEKVYHTSAHNAMASRAIVDKLMPLLPKDNEEANVQVRQLYVMLNIDTMTNPVVDVLYAASLAHRIINVALHWEYSLGIVFI
jgi:hypothetical protein